MSAGVRTGGLGWWGMGAHGYHNVTSFPQLEVQFAEGKTCFGIPKMLLSDPAHKSSPSAILTVYFVDATEGWYLCFTGPVEQTRQEAG